MRVKIEQRGIYETLVSQLDRIARHNRQGSYHTKRRYYEAEKRFCAYLADEYHLQKLSNVSGKHLVSYVIHMQDTDKSASTIKGKGGKIRTVPINEQIAIAMKKQLANTARGHKLLVPDDMPTDRAINRLQFFIMANRGTIQNLNQSHPLTFHGLRHTYAAEKYQELVAGGMGDLDAHFTVSRLLGHERADVTNIYLASVKGGHRDGV